MVAKKNNLFGSNGVLVDGAMGTMLLAAGASLSDCLEGLNVTRPETVGAVHAEYLRAGARVIQTNTFGANGFRLEHFGLRHQVRAINLAGAALARKCVEAVCSEMGTAAYLAGSIGPLGMRGDLPLSAMRAAFAEQIGALAEGGVDLLIAETMMSVAEAEQLVLAARDMAPHLKIAVLMTVDAAGNCLDGASAEMAAERMTAIGADAVGCNCSIGPASVVAAIRRMRGATALPLVAMPSAGLPETVAGGLVYPVSPEAMADFARELIAEGVSWVGGCCGTTPANIRLMGEAMKNMTIDEREAVSVGHGLLQEVV